MGVNLSLPNLNHMTAAPGQPKRDGLLRRLAGDSGYLLSGFPLAVARDSAFARIAFQTAIGLVCLVTLPAVMRLCALAQAGSVAFC
ncbi:MAG: hypothetical protein ACXWZI_03330 [Mycobacterium sp.]